MRTRPTYLAWLLIPVSAVFAAGQARSAPSTAAPTLSADRLLVASTAGAHGDDGFCGVGRALAVSDGPAALRREPAGSDAAAGGDFAVRRTVAERAFRLAKRSRQQLLDKPDDNHMVKVKFRGRKYGVTFRARAISDTPPPIVGAINTLPFVYRVGEGSNRPEASAKPVYILYEATVSRLEGRARRKLRGTGIGGLLEAAGGHSNPARDHGLTLMAHRLRDGSSRRRGTMKAGIEFRHVERMRRLRLKRGKTRWRRVPKTKQPGPIDGVYDKRGGISW